MSNSIIIPQYNRPANIQSLAAQKTIDAQEKQAAIFHNGGNGNGNGITPPIMGDPATQKLANSLTSEIVKGYSLGIHDHRAATIGNVGGRRRYRTRRKKRTPKRKHKKCNKRITKRKYYR